MSVRKRGTNKHWECRFEVEGKEYAFVFNGKKGQSLITTKKEATDKESELRLAIIKGTFIEQSDLSNFAKFYREIYMDYSKDHKTPMSQIFDDYYGGILIEEFGLKNLKDITAPMIEKFISKMLLTKTKHGDTFSPVTVRRLYNLLNQMFRMAIRHRLLTENPCTFVTREVLRKIPAWQPRDRWLNKFEPKPVLDKEGNPIADQPKTEEELLLRTFTWAGEHLVAITKIILNTGLRPGEVLKLKKEHINLSDKSIWFKIKKQTVLLPPNSLIVEESKSGKPRTIPLNRLAREVFEVLLKDESLTSWLFVSRTGERMKSIKRGFSRAVARAKIDNLRSHDLRHTFATRLLERDIHPYVIENLMGHSELSGFGIGSKITPAYSHVEWHSKMSAVESLEYPVQKQDYSVFNTETAVSEDKSDKSRTNEKILQKAG